MINHIKLCFLICIFLIFPKTILAQHPKTISYKHHELINYADYSKERFDTSLFLSNKRFTTAARFDSAHFKQSAKFAVSKFDSLADFYQAIFDSSAFFIGAEFEDEVDFSKVDFGSIARFMDVKFKGPVDFNFTKFDSIADFRYAEFYDEVSFIQIELPQKLLINNFRSKEVLDFSNVITKKGRLCKLYLDRTNFSKIKFNYINFQLAFDSLSIKGNTIRNIYENLLPLQTEFPSGYKKLDIEYRQFKYSQEGILGLIYNDINKWWWNYGYTKELIFLHTFIIIIILTVINWIRFNFLNKKVYPIPYLWTAYTFSINSRQSILVSGYRRLIYAFFYTCLIFFGFKMEFREIKFQNLLGSTYILFIYILGIFCLFIYSQFCYYLIDLRYTSN